MYATLKYLTVCKIFAVFVKTKKAQAKNFGLKKPANGKRFGFYLG